ncbi:SAM-dependent methyltransferase [Streptomyces ipomoeae]|uniref:SAM-dependent methyltransferase n=1 Tax=Streptomyces ipomoeae TaxID=103232 RepID=UPI00215CB256|nr:SAM-dependent methyltransferase [Streptomyces ipomoeae]
MRPDHPMLLHPSAGIAELQARPSSARMQNYLLGGRDHYIADHDGAFRAADRLPWPHHRRPDHRQETLPDLDLLADRVEHGVWPTYTVPSDRE